jgi:nucleotide-binding universal stress UspA family protein
LVSELPEHDWSGGPWEQVVVVFAKACPISVGEIATAAITLVTAIANAIFVGWADDQTIEKVYAKDTNESQRWADQIMDNAKVNGIKVISKILMVPTTSSSTPAAIVNYAEQNNIDLIVMGTRGRSGFKKMLLGSTALGVLTYAHCPVMIVK